MEIERTTDAVYIKGCLTHKSIWPHIHDDDACSAEDYEPPINDGIYWLKVTDTRPVGVFFLHPHNSICFEIHTCLLPEIWGRTQECTAVVIAWVFENTPCERLITNVPAYNKLAMRLAKRSGMMQFGVNEKSYLKSGILQDQVMFGISKENT